MRVAFYAPMKPPGHAVPSGDREIARLLVRALGSAGHAVEVASRFVSRDGKGNADRQERLREIGLRLADRLIRRYRARPAGERPDAWLTYHVYHKAPDWLGPAVAEALAIPYLLVEASSAPKRAGGPWDIGYRGANAAIARARDGRHGLARISAAFRRRHALWLAVRLAQHDPPHAVRTLPLEPRHSLAVDRRHDAQRRQIRVLRSARQGALRPYGRAVAPARCRRRSEARGDRAAADRRGAGSRRLSWRAFAGQSRARLCRLRSVRLAGRQRSLRHGVARGPGRRAAGRCRQPAWRT